MSPLWSKGPSWPSAAHCIYTAHLVFSEQSEATYSTSSQRSVSARLFFINNMSVCVKGCSCIYICMCIYICICMGTCVWVHVYIYAYTRGNLNIFKMVPPSALYLILHDRLSYCTWSLPLDWMASRLQGILLSLSQHWDYRAISYFLYGWWASKLRLSMLLSQILYEPSFLPSL